MTDLGGGAANTGRPTNGAGASTPPSAPQPTTGGIRTPRDVMNQRQAREAARQARMKAEGEAAAEEQRRLDLQRRESARRRAAAQGVGGAARDSGYRSAPSTAGPSTGGRTPGQPQFSYTDPSGYPSQAASGAGPSRTGPSARPGPSAPQDTSRAQQSAAGTQQPQSQPQPATGTSQTTPGTSAIPPDPRAAGGTQQASNTSSFPHAFERWETLSSHWEGLTSYWIRRLEQNTEEIRRDITRHQMSRQITDLSAAGANLFHAVVELQRLRASSERKFQRWFFDVQKEQQKAHEVEERLLEQLESERQGRNRAIPTTMPSADLERQRAEMRRELQISKDEARRAWEELGRREQEERERTAALRDGLSIYVGGIEVQPTQGLSRGGSLQRPTTRGEGGYRVGPQPQPPYGTYEQERPSPTNTDPFTESSRPGPPMQPSQTGQYYSTGPATEPVIQPLRPQAPPQTTSAQQTSSAAAAAAAQPAFYHQPQTLLHDPAAPMQSAFSAGTISEEESEEGDAGYELDEHGQIRRDAQGRPIPFRVGTGGGAAAPTPTAATGVQREDFPTTTQSGLYSAIPGPSIPSSEPPIGTALTTTAHVPASSATVMTQPPSQPPPESTQRPGDAPADYEGQGFGSGSGWENYPTHHHPSRLSDVLEEDDERHP